MPRKVFISFLGYSNYGGCHYCKDDYKSAEVRYVQEATLEYLTRKETWGEDSLALILLTQGAEAKNWVDDGHRDRDTKEIIHQSGLCTQLEHMQLPFEVRPVRNLPDGNSEQEIWTIFSRIFDELRDEDELYFDLTHGFRYLPMLVLVLGNYAKFLKHATVRHISYGNFEGRNKDNEAPLIDLLPLTQLQDWTFAAANYLQNGYPKELERLASKAVAPLLKSSLGKDEKAASISKYAKALSQVVNERLMCRGIDIIESTSFAKLHQLSEQAEQANVVAPLQPIIKHINDSFVGFTGSRSVLNGVAAAKWCANNNLYQQAITILQETVVTFICDRNDLDWQVPNERDLVNKAFDIKIYSRPKDNWIVGHCDSEVERIQRMKTVELLLCDEALEELASSFSVSTTIRNDFNHAGMRDNPSKIEKMKKNIDERLSVVEKILKTYVQVQACQTETATPVFLNLTNHPSADWVAEQREAAQAYGEIVDFPFPAVDPEWSEEEIAAKAEEIVAQITADYGTECTVHLMGEFTLAAALLSRFLQRGINCVASTTKRIIEQPEPGKKVTEFKFVKFRKYC